jgi:hypothetical protein
MTAPSPVVSDQPVSRSRLLFFERRTHDEIRRFDGPDFLK